MCMGVWVYYVYECVCILRSRTHCTYVKVRIQLFRVSYLFHSVGLRYRTQVLSLDGRYPYPLNHLSSLSLSIWKEMTQKILPSCHMGSSIYCPSYQAAWSKQFVSIDFYPWIYKLKFSYSGLNSKRCISSFCTTSKVSQTDCLWFCKLKTLAALYGWIQCLVSVTLKIVPFTVHPWRVKCVMTWRKKETCRDTVSCFKHFSKAHNPRTQSLPTGKAFQCYVEI